MTPEDRPEGSVHVIAASHERMVDHKLDQILDGMGQIVNRLTGAGGSESSEPSPDGSDSAPEATFEANPDELPDTPTLEDPDTPENPIPDPEKPRGSGYRFPGGR